MRIGNRLYFDYQAATPVDTVVMSAMAPFHTEIFGNPHSSDHVFGWEAARAVENAALQVARLIGCDSDEVVFTSGATEANNLALLGVGRRAAGGNRRRMLVSSIEHKCVLGAARALHEQLGYTVEYLPVDGEGVLDMESFERALGEDVLLVSIIGVNNEIGTIQNIEAISRLAHSYGALLHCDAAQAPVAMDISSAAEYVDTLSLSAHKMYGPKGIGALFISRSLQSNVEPLFYGGNQQNGLRSGTVPVALCVGLGAAAELWTGLAAHNKRSNISRLRDLFLARLHDIKSDIAYNGPRDNRHRHPGNINVRFSGFVAADILGVLQPHLAASNGAACTSGIPEPSHVLHAIGSSPEEANASIRFSLGLDTTEEDVYQAVALIRDALERLSKVHARSLG